MTESLQEWVEAWLGRQTDGGQTKETVAREVLDHGLVSGFPELTYYKDTHALFDRFYEEIETLRGEVTEETGETPEFPDGDLKNWLVWFAVEETLRRLYPEV